jgi:hypothetical protein
MRIGVAGGGRGAGASVAEALVPHESQFLALKRDKVLR